MEKPGWQLAESKLMLRLTYNYPLILRGRVELQDHRYEMAELIPIKNTKKLIRSAENALLIAYEIDEASLIYEAKCVIAGLKAYKAIAGFINEIDKKSINSEKLIRYFNELKKVADTMRKSIMKWVALVTMDGTVQMKRVIDTSIVLYRALDGFKRYFDETNLQLSEISQTVSPLGEWDESSFGRDGKGIIEYDVTSYIHENGKGRYYISLDFVDSDSGTDLDNITLVEKQPGGGEKSVSFVIADIVRMSVWSPWREYPIKVNNLGIINEYILRMEISGMEKGAKTCRGLVGIRKV